MNNRKTEINPALRKVKKFCCSTYDTRRVINRVMMRVMTFNANSVYFQLYL